MRNVFHIDVDLKKSLFIEEPVVTQNDANEFNISVLDNGLPVDLGASAITPTLVHTRPDGVVFVTQGKQIGENVLQFSFDIVGISIPGRVQAAVQIYGADGRTTTARFTYTVLKDPTGLDYQPTEPERTLIQIVLEDGPLVIADALTATQQANAARDSADAAALSANTEAAYATEQGDYAKQQGDAIQDTVDDMNIRIDSIIAHTGEDTTEIVDGRLGADNVARANIGTLMREIHSEQLNSARQTQTLQHGVSVVNGKVGSPLDVQIQGRTLTSLGNSNLQSGKKYVLADNKTKLIVKGSMGDVVTGVAKFTNNYLTTTADFLNKVSGSTVANAHIARYENPNNNTTNLLVPSDVKWVDQTVTGYTQIQKLDGAVNTSSRGNLNGHIAQHLFSFNIIEQVERTLGRIPKDTVADKVQWIKDNVNKLTANWHGFGSSVGGNKATFGIWRADSSSWYSGRSHALNTVSKLQYNDTNLSPIIDSNGFVHYIAYAEPSDGVTASTINTDYIDLVVELKDTAQLDTRPTIIRVANFEGKVSGSTVENPHVSKVINAPTLSPPSSFSAEINTSGTAYAKVTAIDGNSYSYVGSTSGNYAQQLFSFNLIEEVERQIGRIPKSTVTDKVQWLKENLHNVLFNWWGFGSSVGGNSASIALWSTWNSGIWSTRSTHTVSAVGKNSTSGRAYNAEWWQTHMIQPDGFVHFLAYAEPSDGTTASIINTDYVELEIQLKPTANFVDPKVPLYEVPDDEYNKILVDWNADEVKRRYPMVQGTQHLANPYVMVEGENLLPPFTEWTLHANAKVISPYEMELNATANWSLTSASINAISGQSYTFSIESNGYWELRYLDDKDSLIGISPSSLYYQVPYKFTLPTGAKKVRVMIGNNINGIFTFKNPILTLGSSPKPFVPRNPSYLFTDVKLGQIGATKDMLYKQDGAWIVRKAVEKDVVFDGSLAWKRDTATITGLKILRLDNYFSNEQSSNVNSNLVKYNGNVLKPYTSFATNGWNQIKADEYIAVYSSSKHLWITLSHSDSGWTDLINPTDDQIKAYFNGWKYTGDGTTHSWVSIVDGTAPATNTIDYVKANKAPNYTPYKLSYVLATPQIIDVTDKVEGDLAINGLTQVEVGSGVIVREKANLKLDGSSYYICGAQQTTFWNAAKLLNSVSKFLMIYKNRAIDSKWLLNSTSGFSRLAQSDYDPTAEYTVTYLVLDRPQMTSNALEVNVSYANNIRAALDETIKKQSDIATQVSITNRSIIDIYVRVKALEGGI